MKKFKQFLFVMLVALTSSVVVYAQNRTVQINNYVDLDDIALLGEWTVVSHTNSDNRFSKIVFSSSGAFTTWSNESAVITCENGEEYRFYEYWLSGSSMGRFTLHMGIFFNSSSKPVSAHFIVKSFKDDDMVLLTYDENEVITLKRNAVQEQNGPQIVDLGLSVNWASYNLGASAPEEAGELYSWSTTIAETMWGEGWRLPTFYEANELVNYCQWEEVNLNGEDVMKATGPNGNFIYFPNTGFNHFGLTKSNSGVHWTSTPALQDYFYYLETSTSGARVPYGNISRLGDDPKLAIRPVTKSPASSSIQSISTKSDKNTNVYDLNGRVIKENVDSQEPLNELPKGIYIVDGKKIGK